MDEDEYLLHLPTEVKRLLQDASDADWRGDFRHADEMREEADELQDIQENQVSEYYPRF